MKKRDLRKAEPAEHREEPLWELIYKMRRAGYNPGTIADMLGFHPREIQAINLEIQRLLRVEGLSDDQTPTPTLDRVRRRLTAGPPAPRPESIHLPGSEVYGAVVDTLVTGRTGG